MYGKIGIIGYGNMGSAIGEQLKSKYKIFGFDKDVNKTKNISEINVTNNIVNLVNEVNVIILAVKPQDFENLLAEIKNTTSDKLIISIAAGITTSYIEKRLGNVRVVRVMPNMPAKIGKGMSCLCKGKFATEEDLNFTKQLFDNLGKTLILEEDMMDAATAISGSGPGYYFDIVESEAQKYSNNPDKVLEYFINSLTEAAEDIGFAHDDAMLLANTTGNSSQTLLVKTKLTPTELKRQITSKGGTTEAGLEVLHRGGSLKDAVKAALKRAKKLSRS